MTLNEQINYLIKVSKAASIVVDFSRKTKTYEARQLRNLLDRMQVNIDGKICELAKLSLQEHEKFNY